MAIALIWLFSALVNPSAALSATAPGLGPSLAPPVGLFTVSGDQRWRHSRNGNHFAIEARYYQEDHNSDGYGASLLQNLP